MLEKLIISNYALIDYIEIDLHDGLSIITGETGAGKSIILGALSLLLGQRVDSKVIRNIEKKSVIEAVFNIAGYSLDSFFLQNDIDANGDECILRREILPNGRTRAFVNDTPVNLMTITEVASKLVDIHSQHSNALLLEPDYQLKVIDNLSSNSGLRKKYSAAFGDYEDLCRKLDDKLKRISKNKADEEYFRFQFEQIASLHLVDGEQEELEKAQVRLSNVSEIKESLWKSASLLNESDNAVIPALISISHQLDGISGMYEESAQLSERIDSILIEAKDIYSTIAADVENINDDPSELERIDDRLNSIYSLQQKHRVESIAGLLKIQQDLGKALSEIENSDDEIAGLKADLDKAKSKLAVIANELTESRKKAAEQFSDMLIKVASPLGMKNLVCRVDFKQCAFDKSGQDKIRFLFAFNKNQEPMPVEKTASGGEISRLMLCIKSIIAEKMQLPSIIFDEVDTGVSGEVANKIGEMMRRISQRIQVITITHLPQVAALGAHHYKVFKKDVEHSTVTNIAELDAESRIKEIAGMLSGSKIDSAAINNAKSLLGIKH